MALWISSVTLDGFLLDLDAVNADVTIHHGRTDISDDPSASTCQLTIRGVDKSFVRTFEVGSTIVVSVQDPPAAAVPRFTGRITDARLEVDQLTAIATARLSTLGAYVIGEVNWPMETWSARVSRCFSEAGLAAQLELYPDPGFNPLLVERTAATAGPTTLADYLAFLAPMVGASVTDRGSGKILVQALGARTLADAHALAPADVAYAPAWSQVLPGANVVTVRYTGDQSQSVTASEPSSIAIYGERPQTIDTTFANASDASYRANLRLSRAAFPHWNIPETPVLRGLTLQVGQGVRLSSMPPSSPFEPWTPILEGWTDTIAGDDWTMALALSDPLESGLTLPWVAVPLEPGYRWNTIDTGTDWSEALTLEDLRAG